MRAWAIAAALSAVVAAAAVRAPAQTGGCASLGEAASWDVFSNGDLTMSNTTLAGRAAASGTVTVSQIDIGGQTQSGLDLVAGGDLQTNGGGTVHGDVRYGGTRPAPTELTITGTATHGPPPFSFPAQFTGLTALSSFLGARANTAGAGYVVNQYSRAIEFTAPAAGLNVINVDGTQLAAAAGVLITAPASATVLINVTGPPSLTVPLGYMNLASVTPSRILWNFSGVRDFTLTGSGRWQGTLLAPSTRMRKTGGGQDWNGQLIVASAAPIDNLTALHAPFTGCLPAPPAPEPAPDLQIAGLCVENPGRLVVRLRNLETHAVRDVAWH